MADGEMHILWGNLATDPVSRKTDSGTEICKLKLPVGVYRLKDGKREKVETTWYTLTAFNDYAAFLAQAVHKGSAVRVHAGNLSVRQYKTEKGEHRAELEVILNNGDLTIIQYAPRTKREEPAPKQEELYGEPEGSGDADIPF